MELKEFVRQSLLEISDAVREANTSYKKSRSAEENAFLLFPGGDKEKGEGIHFDLAVTTKTKTGTAGRAGVNIQVLELSTGGQSQQIKENASRISFTVIIGHYVG